MIRSLLSIALVSYCIAFIHAVTPMMSLVRRVHYSRTQYLVPCDICTSALLYEMKYPSANHIEFEKKAPEACLHATNSKFKQQACISLLTRNSHRLVKDQRKGLSVHSSCLNTFMSNCIESETKYAILCDQHKKKGYCHVIPINE